ncbi:MAG: class I SAM-dependent methyltransferase, partial [Candidatus Eremiobacteraeota bacterium]|nr:class I SAM-dependent methyltransferase [Candidatus Eremiobacteraeota bacterium]
MAGFYGLDEKSRDQQMTKDPNYEDPRLAEIYDLDNPWGQDTDFYLALAEAGSCRVLDLGCGTGTLACALAQRGHQVTGVDPAGPMLAIAASKPHAEKVEWIQSCAQEYRSDHRFDLIVMMGHVFQILLTDEELLAVLDSMRQHLKTSGIAAFETRNPNVDWARVWGMHAPVVHKLPSGCVRETLEITGEFGELISFQQRVEFPDSTLTSSSTLRFLSRTQVEGLIARSGMVVSEVFGDWDRSPFEPKHSPEMIFVVE